LGQSIFIHPVYTSIMMFALFFTIRYIVNAQGSNLLSQGCVVDIYCQHPAPKRCYRDLIKIKGVTIHLKQRETSLMEKSPSLLPMANDF